MRGWGAPIAIVAAASATLGAVWLGLHRASSAVQRWGPSSQITSRGRFLASRSAGSNDPVIVLISGLAASERYWGEKFDVLAESATVVAIDPLGFGSSADVAGVGDLADPATHVRMLEATLVERGLAGRPVVVVGHSMGASLALRWAATTDAVRAVVCFGAPLYRTDDEVQRQMKELGWFESLLSRGPLAEAVCHWMCRHRAASRWAAVVMNPGLPTVIAKDAIRHTWAGYIGAFTALIADDGWQAAVDTLARRMVPVTFVEGDRDRASVAGRAKQLADAVSSMKVVTLRGDHHLPLTRPDECIAVIHMQVDRLRGAN